MKRVPQFLNYATHWPVIACAAVFCFVTSSSQAQDWGAVATVSTTMGVNANRLCLGEGSRSDIGCPAYAPYVNPADGYVGIGTTNPVQPLTVSGTIASIRGGEGGGALQLTNTNKTGSGQALHWAIYNMTGPYGGSLQFWAYDTAACAGGLCLPRFTLTDSGKVGIGTTVPYTLLHVSGTLRIADGGEACDADRAGAIRYASGSFDFCDGGGTWKSLASMAGGGASGDRIVSGTSAAVVANQSGGTVSFTLGGTVGAAYLHPALGLVAKGVSTTGTISGTAGDFSGNVSIGTAAVPAAPLSVNGSNNAEAARFGNNGGGNGDTQGKTYIGLSQWGAGVSYNTLNPAIRIGAEEDGLATYNASLVFQTRSTDSDTVPVTRMTIRPDGNVGIGTSNPAYPLDLKGVARIDNNFASPAIVMTNSDKTYYPNVADDWEIYPSGISSGSSASYLSISTRNRTTHAPSVLFNVTSNGYVGIGTINPGAMLHVKGGPILASDNDNYASGSWSSTWNRAFLSQVGYIWSTANSTSNLYLHQVNPGYPFVYFGYGNSSVGSISTNGSTVSYNTTSDYRLKEHVQPVAGALARVALLKPSRFDFIADPSHTTVDGFIAHEVQQVAPYAVTGKKDAVDAKGRPVYQQMDYGRLTPLLTAAIQEQQAEIRKLRADNDNLRVRLDRLEATRSR